MDDSKKLVKETIEEVKNYLPKMIKGIDLFVSYIIQSRDDEAHMLLTDIFNGLDWIVEAIYLTNKIQEGLLKEKELVEKLPLLMDAYENQDLVLVSDILDYEIKPILEKWIYQLQIH